MSDCPCVVSEYDIRRIRDIVAELVFRPPPCSYLEAKDREDLAVKAILNEFERMRHVNEAKSPLDIPPNDRRVDS